MALPPDELDGFPALQPEMILPNGVALVTAVTANLTMNFRKDRAPSLDLPSLWRLAKHVVYEQGPIIVFRYKDTRK